MGAAENLKPTINLEQLTPLDIRYVYRSIIHRAPTNDEIEKWIGKNIIELRKNLVNTEEFRTTLRQSNTKIVGTFLSAPENNIQIEGPSEQFEQMVNRIKTYWSGRGEVDAEFSVLTNPKFTADNIQKNRLEFYSIGERDFDVLKAFFKRNNEPLEAVRSAIDFGCGVGRVSAAMARRFDQVVGVDISPGHLKKAEEWFESQKLANGSFVHLHDLDVIDALPEVDLFYSLIVLQHNPPPMMLEMLKRLLQRVRKDGYALFQLPTYCADYSFTWDQYFTTEPKMEMHSLPQRYVFETLQNAGYRLIECHQDRRASARHMSHTFFAQRSQSG